MSERAALRPGDRVEIRVHDEPVKFGVFLGLSRDGFYFRVKRDGIKQANIYHPSFVTKARQGK